METLGAAALLGTIAELPATIRDPRAAGMVLLPDLELGILRNLLETPGLPEGDSSHPNQVGDCMKYR